VQSLEGRSFNEVVPDSKIGKPDLGVPPISQAFSKLADKLVSGGNLVRKKIISTAKEQIEKMKKSVEFDDVGKELAERIFKKIDECQRLLEDLEVQFRNEISSNGYDESFLDQCNSSVDNLMGSIKSATLFMSN